MFRRNSQLCESQKRHARLHIRTLFADRSNERRVLQSQTKRAGRADQVR